MIAPNSSHLTRGLVKYVPGWGCFRAVSSHSGQICYIPAPPLIVERVRNEPLAGVATLGIAVLQQGGNISERRVAFPP